jgi:hypothetical protein
VRSRRHRVEAAAASHDPGGSQLEARRGDRENATRPGERFDLPGGPLTDSRFCADADGDGRLDIGDAVNILNHLFIGTATPYCIAEGTSLAGFARQADLQVLQARVTVLEGELAGRSHVITGSYSGDGTRGRLVETGAPGRLRALRIQLRSEAGNYYHEATTKLDAMPGSIGTGSPAVSLEGNAFRIDARVPQGDTPVSRNLNIAGREYVWEAHLTQP